MKFAEYKPPVGAKLSPREQELLEHMVAGRRPQGIARLMGLSVKTVSTYRARLIEKSGCKSDAQLGAWYERRRAATFEAPELAVEIKYDANGAVS